MGISKLLVKNSLKSLLKSKFLIAQLGVLTALGTTVISSVFLTNASLRSSLKNLTSQSNQADFTIEDISIDETFNYNISSNGNKLERIDSLDNYEIIKENNLIYNPLITTSIKTEINDNNSNLALFYGFGMKYSNPDYVNNTNYWQNMLYYKDKPLIINPDLTNPNFKDKISDFFTIYNNLSSPSADELESENYKPLWDLNQYVLNPWSFLFDANNQFQISKFGAARIDGFNYDENINLNHGLLYDNLALFLKTENSFLTNNQKELLNNFSELSTKASNDVYMYENYDGFMDNYFKQIFCTNTDTTYYNNLLNIIQSKRFNFYPSNFADFNKQLIENLRTYINMVSPGYICFDYSIDSQDEKGRIKILTDIYNNSQDINHNLVNTTDNQKYFEGVIKIPIIPYLTVLPNEKYSSAKEYLDNWINNPDSLLQNSSINIDSIKSIISNAIISLKNEVNNWTTEVFDTYSIGNDLKRIYNEKYNIKYNLDNGLYINNNHNNSAITYTLSKNFYISDSENTNCIVATSEHSSENNPVNKLITYEGSNLPKVNLPYKSNHLADLYNGAIWEFRDKWENNQNNLTQETFNWYHDYFTSDIRYIKTILNMIYSSNLMTNENTKELVKKPLELILDNDYWLQNPKDWCYQLSYKSPVLRSFVLTGYGGEFSIIPDKNELNFEISGEYIEPSAYFISPSINYTLIKNKTKKVLDPVYVEQAYNLPFSSLAPISIDEINANPEKYQNHFITDPKTGKQKFYQNFLEWKNDLPEVYKMNINGDEFVIIGTSLSAEFLYPISTKNQLLINNNIPIIFTNSAGFEKIFYKNNYDIHSYYWCQNPSSSSSINSNVLNNINIQSQALVGKSIAYKTNDSEQPNQLLYLRVNFPYIILNLIFYFTLIIGIIISLLAIFFIFILLRSIVKQNINNFAICISNGINKQRLALSFLTISVIIGFITSLIGYVSSLFIYPIVSNTIKDYWILNYTQYTFNPGYWFLTFVIITFLISLTLYLVVIFTLRKPTYELLSNTNDLKHNKIMSKFNKTFSKMKPLNLFRFNYVFSNIGKFSILLLMMTSFVTITTTYVSTMNMFNTAVQKTYNHKKYNYAIDLYSPTEQGGYYYNLDYELIGSRQQGFSSLYDLNSDSGIYNSSYKDALTYSIDDNKEIVYENLFLPSALLINDLTQNVQFFRNKIMNILTLDIDIRLANIFVNPLNYAINLMPTTVSNIAIDSMQKQIEWAFRYYLSIQNDSTKLNRNLWINNSVLTDETLLKDITINNQISSNPNLWKQDNWLFQLVDIGNNKFKWQLNQSLVTYGAPNYNININFVKLLIDVMNLYKKPDYVSFLNSQNQTQVDFNYFVALNTIPFDNQTDETYTYIDASDIYSKNKFKIKGIKPDSNQVVLWDEYNNLDLKDKLISYEKQNNFNEPIIKNINGLLIDCYPIIINQVVAKKYNLGIDSILEVNINNKFNRFTNKANNIVDDEIFNFVVVGVTTSKSEEQYFTTQNVANKLIELKKPELASQNDLKSGNYENKWVNQKEIDDYIPFNGVFTKQRLPKIVTNMAPLYSFSGLTPLANSLSPDLYGNGSEQIFANFATINKILHVDNFIDVNSDKSNNTIRNFYEKYTNVFGTNTYFTSALSNIDIASVSLLAGQLLDKTFSNVLNIATIAIIPSILIIVLLMSYMMVQESKRIISLLKVLGYNNWTNTLTLSVFQFVILAMSLLIGFGLSSALLKLLEFFIFKQFFIIISPIVPWWIVLSCLGALLLIVLSVMLSMYGYLKKVNLAKEVSYR